MSTLISRIKKSYEHTIYASYLGYITQAIVNNFAPLLFLTFVQDYGLSLEQITLLTTINFAVQLMVDLIATKTLDKVGYRKAVVVAHASATAGLVGMAVFPGILGNVYVGLLIAVILYAIGGGIIEVAVSPLVEACPTEKKEAAMSLLHSFYCWGQVGVVLISTIFFTVVGISNWRILAFIWALVPLTNCIYFALVPIYTIVSEKERVPLRNLLKRKYFWLLMVVMFCAGASEMSMGQWASAFAEKGLQVSKTVGDLAGPCAFAALMGTARAVYGKYSDKIPLKKMMIGSACLCIVCYLVTALAPNPIVGLIGCAVTGFSVGIFWPGTYSVAAWNLPGAGTAMYALMALAGDLGCSGGPTLVGMVADAAGGDLKKGILVAAIFPVVIFMGTLLLKEKKE